MKKLTTTNKKALKRSFLASLGRLLGVVLGAGAGSLIKDLVGGGVQGWGIAVIMALVSFVLVWFTEFKRETSL